MTDIERKLDEINRADRNTALSVVELGRLIESYRKATGQVLSVENFSWSWGVESIYQTLTLFHYKTKTVQVERKRWFKSSIFENETRGTWIKFFKVVWYDVYTQIESYWMNKEVDWEGFLVEMNRAVQAEIAVRLTRKPTTAVEDIKKVQAETEKILKELS